MPAMRASPGCLNCHSRAAISASCAPRELLTRIRLASVEASAKALDTGAITFYKVDIVQIGKPDFVPQVSQRRGMHFVRRPETSLRGQPEQQ
jgi:hypothetical protein